MTSVVPFFFWSRKVPLTSPWSNSRARRNKRGRTLDWSKLLWGHVRILGVDTPLTTKTSLPVADYERLTRRRFRPKEAFSGNGTLAEIAVVVAASDLHACGGSTETRQKPLRCLLVLCLKATGATEYWRSSRRVARRVDNEFWDVIDVSRTAGPVEKHGSAN